MREILNYPEIDRQKLDAVKSLIDGIANNANGDYIYSLNELNRLTSKNYDAAHFFEYWGWTDLDNLAEEVLTPEPPCVRDISRDELVQIVIIIKDSMISLNDIKTEYYIELLHRSLPLSDVMRYIRLEEDEETIVNNLLRACAGSVIEL